MIDQLTCNGNLIESLSSALRFSGSGLNHVPPLLRQVLTNEAWREFKTGRGTTVHYDRFEDCATTPPLQGLGSGVALIRRIISDENDLVDLLDEATRRPHGGAHGRSKTNIVSLAQEAPGNSKEGALRRLRKDRPDLHKKVLAGELSPHAAAVEAGFRRRTITVPVDLERAAIVLRRHFDAAALAKVLLEHEADG